MHGFSDFLSSERCVRQVNIHANSLYKLEVIEYLKSDWTGLADVELATLNWADWFNKKRLHRAIGYVSPEKHCFVRFEAMYYDRMQPLDQVA